MSRLGKLVLPAMALLFLGVAMTSGDAVGQEKTLKEQLIGTWTYVSVDTVRPDGSRVPIFGPNPQGLAGKGGEVHVGFQFGPGFFRGSEKTREG